jgi:tRNA-splicing ligase RtcB
MQFKRLARALLREGVEITQDGPIYKIRRASHDGPAAEVLLPEGFPLETKAVKQLAMFASASHPEGGHVCGACATPDFHPGNLVPVGCVVETSDMVIPQAIGTDINCGMRLDLIDVTVDQFLSRKKELVALLRGDLLLGTRDLPMTPATLHAIYEHGAYGWEEELYKNPMGLMARSKDHLALDAKYVWHRGSFASDTKWVKGRIDFSRDVIRDPDLGTVGGGNHFVEIQVSSTTGLCSIPTPTSRSGSWPS